MLISRVRHSLAARLRRFRLYHRTVAELNALGDRDLADLGLRRGDIPEVARSTLN